MNAAVPARFSSFCSSAWSNGVRRRVGAAASSLHGLDARARADIGLDPSEIGSVESESQGLADATRRRLVLAAGHV